MSITVKKLSDKVDVIETEEDLMTVLEDVAVQHTRLAKEYMTATDERKEEIESEIRVLKRAERFLKGKWDDEDFKVGNVLH